MQSFWAGEMIGRTKTKLRKFRNHVQRILEYPFLSVKAEIISCEFNRVIEGVAYDMSPAPSTEHQGISLDYQGYYMIF